MGKEVVTEPLEKKNTSSFPVATETYDQKKMETEPKLSIAEPPIISSTSSSSSSDSSSSDSEAESSSSSDSDVEKTIKHEKPTQNVVRTVNKEALFIGGFKLGRGHAPSKVAGIPEKNRRP